MLAVDIPLNTFTGSALPAGTTVGISNLDNTILTSEGNGPILSSLIPTQTIAEGSITTTMIADGAITSAKIASGVVTAGVAGAQGEKG